MFEILREFVENMRDQDLVLLITAALCNLTFIVWMIIGSTINEDW